jgi:acyl carrier protein
LEDAARVVVLRSRALMKLTGSGGMVAVSLPTGEVEQRLAPWADRLWLAVHSGPTSVVVAGDVDALDEFTAACGEDVQTRRIDVDYASHTPHIENLREELSTVLGGVAPVATDVGFCSSLAGSFISTTQLSTEYWYENLRNPVRFDQAVGAFAGYGTPLFIEVSPHPVLGGDVEDTLHANKIAGGVCSTLRRNAGDWPRFLTAAAQAYVLGAPVDWAAVLGPAPARQVDLPTYAFDRRRYWLDGATGGNLAAGADVSASRHPLLTAVVPLADGRFLLTGQLSRDAAPWSADHAVAGTVLFPGSGLVDLAMEAATVAGCDRVEELTLESALVLPESGTVDVQLAVAEPDADQHRAITIFTRSVGRDEWVRCASGVVAPSGMVGGACEWAEVWPPAGSAAVDVEGGYQSLLDAGYEYGPSFRGVSAVWRRGEDEYFAEIVAPDGLDVDGFAVHPAVLDAAFHPLMLAGGADQLRLPFVFGGVTVWASGASLLQVRLVTSGEDVLVEAADAAGRPVLRIDSLRVREMSAQALMSAAGEAGPMTYGLDWVEVTTPAGADASRWRYLGEPVPGLAGFADLAELAAAIDAGEPTPDYLVSSCAGDAQGVPAAVRELSGRALDLVQSWLADDRFAACRLVFATRGVFDTPAPGVAGVAGGSVWGLVRSAQSEHPGRFLLADVPDGFRDWALLAPAAGADESQLLVRDGTVLVPRLSRRVAQADRAELAAIEQSEIDGSGTVLVTGGTGGLGALVAERLVARHGVRHLMLTSRRGGRAPGVATLVSHLEGLGASVSVAACDVSDRAAVASLLDRIPADRPLVGVVHAAGVLDDAMVEGLSAQRMDVVLRPKVDAAWHLHELTGGLPLSMFVVFSSLAGVLGNPGQGNYAAANAVLDGLAGYRRAHGLPALSVAWGLWDTDTGMTGGLTAAEVARLARSGVAPLTVEQGLDLFDAALGSPDPVVVAANWDSAGLRARAQGGALPPVLRSMVRGQRRVAATAASRGGPAGLVARLAAMAEQDAQQTLTDLVRTHVAAVLAHPSMDAVDVDRAFSELGFDSLTAVELRNRLDGVTGLRLPATVAFDHPTVTMLAEHLYHSLAPAAPSPEDTLRASLEQVQRMLPDDDEDARTKIIAILQSTLTRLGAAPNGSSGVQEKISSASDDEIFAFIDNQL